MIVALDTVVIIYSMGQGRAHGKDIADLQRRARILRADLQEKNHTIVVPTIVVAELLLGLDKEHHGQFIAEIQRTCLVAPFNIRASAVAAELWLVHHKLDKKQQVARTVLKADAMIVASAQVAGASIFYSCDPKCRKLAVLAGLKARDLPTHSENLFTNLEEQ